MAEAKPNSGVVKPLPSRFARVPSCTTYARGPEPPDSAVCDCMTMMGLVRKDAIANTPLGGTSTIAGSSSVGVEAKMRVESGWSD